MRFFVKQNWSVANIWLLFIIFRNLKWYYHKVN